MAHSGLTRMPHADRPKKISVRVKPSAREARVTTIDGTRFLVAVREPAQGGKANAGVQRAIASRFGVSPSSVRIKSGHTSRRKIIEIG